MDNGIYDTKCFIIFYVYWILSGTCNIHIYKHTRKSCRLTHNVFITVYILLFLQILYDNFVHDKEWLFIYYTIQLLFLIII